jgi:hypothetical protein
VDQLPDDIREEIEQAYSRRITTTTTMAIAQKPLVPLVKRKKRTYTRKSKSTTTPTCRVDSCSKVLVPTPTTTEMSLDDLDMEVLNALPEELRLEVITSLKQQTTHTSKPSTSASTVGSSTGINTIAMTVVQAPPCLVSAIELVLTEEPCRENNNEKESKSFGHLTQQQLLLFGNRRFEELRPLFNEWLTKVFEDLKPKKREKEQRAVISKVESVVQRFVVGWLSVHVLEDVEKFLRLFQRRIQQESENEEGEVGGDKCKLWKELWNDVLESIQHKMIQCYGGQLAFLPL